MVILGSDTDCCNLLSNVLYYTMLIFPDISPHTFCALSEIHSNTIGPKSRAFFLSTFFFFLPG